SPSIAAEIEAMQAAEQARRLERPAAGVAPEPLRSHLGAVGVRRTIDFNITDMRKLLTWMLRTPGIVGQIEQAARTIVGKYLHSLGVAAVDRGIAIPGVEVRIEKQVQVR